MNHTLATRALLAHLTRSQWNQYAFDKTATEEVTQSHNADSKAGRFNKKLLEGSPNLKAVQRAFSEVYTHHMVHTLPWVDQGPRLLPSKAYFEYVADHNDLVSKALAAVDKFIDQPAYFNDIQNDSLRLGALFDADLYPSPGRMRELFGVTLRFLPVPDERDFRVDLPDAAMDALRKTTQDAVAQSVTNATKDLYARLYAPLKAMRDKLAIPIGAEGATFRDSLVGNVQEAIELLPNLNIMGDPNLELLLREVERDLGECTPTALRCLSGVREDARAKADAIMEQMGAYMGAV